MKPDKNVELYYSIYKGEKDVVFEEENLPFPYVHSGINYFAFSKAKRSKPYICSCQKESIANALELYDKYYKYHCVSSDNINAMVGSLNLPIIVCRVQFIAPIKNINGDGGTVFVARL